MCTLIGVMDSNIGGINSYIVNFIQKHCYEKFIILTNGKIHDTYYQLIKDNSTICIIPSVSHPIKLYGVINDIVQKKLVETVYLNVSTNLFFPIILAASKNKISVAVHSHSSYSAERLFLKRYIIVAANKLLTPLVNKLATEKMCCSKKAARWLFGTDEGVKFIHNSVSKDKYTFNSTEREKIRKELQLENKIIIGFVGMFCFPKNNEWFIKFARLIKDDKMKILMIGEGENFALFVKKMNKYGLNDKFILLGNKTDANRYYNAMDYFILPSRFEGLGYVGIEAQVNGLKCFFSKKIPKEVKITKEAEFFALRNTKEILKKIQDSDMPKHQNTPIKHFSDFVISEVK